MRSFFNLLYRLLFISSCYIVISSQQEDDESQFLVGVEYYLTGETYMTNVTGLPQFINIPVSLTQIRDGLFDISSSYSSIEREYIVAPALTDVYPLFTNFVAQQEWADESLVPFLWQWHAEVYIISSIAHGKPLNSFSNNMWFEYTNLYWPKILRTQVDLTKPLHILEIGSHEGGSATFFQKYMLHHPDSSLTCVDPWVLKTPGKAHDYFQNIFHQNICTHPNFMKTTVIKGDSLSVMTDFMNLGKAYDIIYIDGGHHMAEVMGDLVLGFRLLKAGGIMIMDDYNSNLEGIPSERPHEAIDLFLTAFEHELEILHSGYQVFVKKAL